MLKIKKQIPFSLKFDEDEYNKNQEDIKNLIKKLYIGNQSKKKTIDEYAQLTTQIREEYAKLENKCMQLENTIQKYKDYIDNSWSHARQRMPRDVRRPLRKTKIPYYRYENEREAGYLTEDEGYDDVDDYYTREGISKPKRKKRIVYVDEIDGDGDENEVYVNDEGEGEVDEIEESEVRPTRVVKKVVPTKKKTKKDTKKVGITRSI